MLTYQSLCHYFTSPIFPHYSKDVKAKLYDFKFLIKMSWLNSIFSPTSHFNLLKTRNNVLLTISSNKNIKFIFTDGVGLGRNLAPPSILQWVWFYHMIKRDASVQFRAKNESSLKKNPLETANTWEKVKCRLIYHFRYWTGTSSACSKLSVSGDDRKSGKAGIGAQTSLVAFPLFRSGTWNRLEPRLTRRNIIKKRLRQNQFLWTNTLHQYNLNYICRPFAFSKNKSSVSYELQNLFPTFLCC